MMIAASTPQYGGCLASASHFASLLQAMKEHGDIDNCFSLCIRILIKQGSQACVMLLDVVRFCLKITGCELTEKHHLVIENLVVESVWYGLSICCIVIARQRLP
jgi:hypothetical protein